MFNLNGKIKMLAMVIVDAVLIVTAFSLSIYLRFDWLVPTRWLDRLESVIIPIVLINLIVYYLSGFYRRIWRYAGIDDLMFIVIAVSIGLGTTYAYTMIFGMLPRSSYIIAWFLLLFFIGGSRLVIRLLHGYLSKTGAKGKMSKALIVGAGEAGVLVAKELKRHRSALALKVVGFVDDDKNKLKQIIHGLPVIGTCSSLKTTIKQHDIDEVIIAMPSAPYSVLQDIIKKCAEISVKIKTVPGIFEIVKGNVSINTLKEVEIEDLLQRTPVDIDLNGIAKYLTNEIVLVTGAGGSIGAELCRQIAVLKPKKLILLDHDENGIFYIDMELRNRTYSNFEIVPLILDIQSQETLDELFRTHKPNVVFHAAAYKHVPLMEINAEEAVRNNIFGSIALIDLAAKYETKRFVFVSTDKAVNPSSVMGATKRVVEIYLQYQARKCNNAVFCAVRFGNVLGSQGSVMHLFRKQIASGGPVTVTHSDMKRYFMTIPEAVQLVIQAGALGKGGEIFVLDMGEPIKIVDLARDMIILSGLNPEQDIKIEFTGLRPGEKLYEELFNDRENFAITKNERIYIAPDNVFSDFDVRMELKKLSEQLGLGYDLYRKLKLK